MKKIIAFVLISTMLFCISGCKACDDYIKNNFSAGGFVCKVLSDGTLAVGDVSGLSDGGDALFIPYEINGYTVTQLGFPSAMGFGGNGSLNTRFRRVYFPNTIKSVDSNNEYVFNYTNDKVFYCGSVMGLSKICTHRCFYVPYQQLEEFTKKTSSQNTILKANVGYYLNYDENNYYYYVDYYENEETIKYVPPIPERDGYSFDGWYKEAECLNKWDFDVDTVQTDEENEEVGLYAKWIKS